MSGVSGKISGDATVAYKPSLFVPAVDMSLGLGSQNVKLLASSLVPGSVFTPQQFGAVGNGVADDTVAIQAAINAAAPTGGTVQFAPGTYKITTSLNIGNGTPTAASTQNGVTLRGAGIPAMLKYFGWFDGQVSPTVITWAGASSTIPMINVNGPVEGFGVQDMEIDGALVARTGFAVTAGCYGDNRNLYIHDCVGAGIYSTVTATVNSMHSSWRNISIQVPAVAGATGIALTGTDGITATTCFNVFQNVTIGFASGAQTNYGIFLANCDSNQFNCVEFIGGGADTIAVYLDYAPSSGICPAANAFYHIDTDVVYGGPLQYINNGTPGATAAPNYIYGVMQANSGTNPNLANLAPSLPTVWTPTVYLVNQTAALSAHVLEIAPAAGLYRVSVALSVSAAGANQTVTAEITWGDGVTGQSAATASVNTSVGGATSSVFTLYVAASSGIQYLTALSGSLGTGRYNLYIVAEKLS